MEIAMRTLLPLFGAAVLWTAPTMSALAQESAPGATAASPGEASQQMPAAQTASSGADAWPCEQPERAEISIGSFWSGPDPSNAEDTWRNTPAVTALIDQIAPRRMPQDDAVAAIHRFSAGYSDPKQRATVLTQVFAGLFDTLDKERRQILTGIRHFNRRQDALSKRIEAGWKSVDALDPNSTDPAINEQRASLQQAIDWDSRIFDDRQRLLPAICQQPSVIEQRLFALSRALQQDLGGPTQ